MNYYERYNELISGAQANPSKYPGETHHIIPRSIHKLTPSTTPVNAPENLVFLSHRQHLEAHWLLFKAYENTVHAGSMAAAFVCMINLGKTPAQPTAEQYHAYEAARIAANEAQSERQTGRAFSAETKAKMSAAKFEENNPNFGKGHLMMGEKNHMFGKPKPKGAGTPSKPVINTETGEVWESVRECARQLGVQHMTIRLRIKRKSHGGIWQYVENHNKPGGNLNE